MLARRLGWGRRRGRAEKYFEGAGCGRGSSDPGGDFVEFENPLENLDNVATSLSFEDAKETQLESAVTVDVFDPETQDEGGAASPTVSKGALRQLSFDEVVVNIEHSSERQEVPDAQSRRSFSER